MFPIRVFVLFTSIDQLGYLSGLAMQSDKDVLAGLDAPSLYLWVTNYCKANPLETTTNAGYILFLELSKKLRK